MGIFADEGELVYAHVVEARREGLVELLEGWAPEEHDDVLAMLDRFARQLVTEIPEQAAPARS